ncbi:hypothetical protein [Thiomonas sp.]|uniref:hypothetical protein n=1 Tax=Thiomonas sp. TaxID=2047785 RepID=UPI00262E5D12|nr:hypothetical protein [Thiomonas sp.]
MQQAVFAETEHAGDVPGADLLRKTAQMIGQFTGAAPRGELAQQGVGKRQQMLGRGGGRKMNGHFIWEQAERNIGFSGGQKQPSATDA